MTRKDPVTPELHAAVLVRDRGCILAKIEPDHLCRDTWGTPHASTDLAKLTLEHVHDGYGQMGKRAPSDRRHLLALCAAANVGAPSKSQRAAFRAYLAAVES